MSDRAKRIGHLEEDLEKQAKEICRDFAQFIHGTRYITLLHRTKDGGHNKEYKRRGGYYVTHSAEEYYDAIVRLLTLQTVTSKPYRLYASVNARSLKKAERAFKMDMLMCDFEDGENKEFFWTKLESKWVGALMQPGSRDKGQPYFILDVDGEGDVTAPILKWLGANGIEPVKQYRTPNGWHIVTPPFNPELVPGDIVVDVKKDGLLLLHA